MPANTPVLALPYPVPADTADVPRDIQALATKIDTLRTPVTSLPASPYSGQEIVLVLNAAAGVLGQFRYNGASASTYKWEAIGATGLFAAVNVTEGRAVNTYGDLATPGPSIALPFAGDWDVDHGCEIVTPVTANSGYASYAVGAATASDLDAVVLGTNANFALDMTLSRSARKAGLAAVTLTMKYRTNAATNINFGYRWIRARPVRIG